MGAMLTITKLLIILFLLCLWEQGTLGQLSKQISKLSFKFSFRYILFLPKLKGKESSLLEGGAHCEIIPKSTWFV